MGGEGGVGAGNADPAYRAAPACDGGDAREVGVAVCGAQVDEELVDLVEDVVGAGIGAIKFGPDGSLWFPQRLLHVITRIKGHCE